MKTRQGFVSNSSSSSFVLIIGKETADKIISTLNPSTKEIVNWLKKEIQIEDKKAYLFEGCSGEGPNTFDDFIPSKKLEKQLEKDDKCFDEYWEEFEELAIKAGATISTTDF